MNKAQPFFDRKKIRFVLFLSLCISAWLIYKNFSTPHFIPAENGNYTWIDANSNQQLEADEMHVDTENGSFKKVGVWEIMQTISWNGPLIYGLLTALLFMIGRDFFYILRIKLLTNNELTWKRSTIVILLWEFASALSPGVVGGASVAMFILNREKIALGRSTAIVVITAWMDNLFYVVMIPFVFFFIDRNDLFPQNISFQQPVELVFWTGFGIILLVCLLLFLSLFFFPNLITRFLSFLFRLAFLKKWRPQAIQTGKDLEIAAHIFRTESMGYWIKVFCFTLGSWISRYLVINALFAAFLSISFLDHIQILGKQLVLWLFMLVSPTPGGSGVAEFAFQHLLHEFSSDLVILTLIILIWRLISYFPYLLIGLFILPKWLGQKE